MSEYQGSKQALEFLKKKKSNSTWSKQKSAEVIVLVNVKLRRTEC